MSILKNEDVNSGHPKAFTATPFAIRSFPFGFGEIVRGLLLLSLATCAHGSPGGGGPVTSGSPTKFSHASNASSMTISSPSQPRVARILGQDPRGCTWVESSGSDVRSEDVKPAVILGLAVARAEDRAIRALMGGEELESTLLDTGSSYGGHSDQYVESDLRSQELARIIARTLLSKTPSIFEGKDCGGCLMTRISVRYRFCVLRLPPQKDRLMVRLSLNHPFYREGDMAVVHIFVGQDSYLYMIDQNPADQTFSLIVPNPQFMATWHAKAGETVVFPSKEIMQEGIVLQAELPPGTTESHEILRVIATAKPLPPDIFLAGTKTTDDLFSRLNQEGISYNVSDATFTILGNGKPNKKEQSIQIRSSKSSQ